MDLVYLQNAVDDLDHIITYIVKNNIRAAVTMLMTFDHFLSQLVVQPELGKIPNRVPFNKLGWRFLNVSNYIVFYVIHDSEVEIRRIVHGWETHIEIKQSSQNIFTPPRIAHKEVLQKMHQIIDKYNPPK